MGLRTRLMLDAWESLRSRPGRTLLSMLAVAIGMGALAVLVAVLGGLNERARSLVADLGGNVLAVLRSGSDDGGALAERHVRVLQYAMPGSRLARARRQEAPTLGTPLPITVVGVGEHMLDLRGWVLREGRFLDASDVMRAERHAVLSAGLADAWKWGVGDAIRLGETVFRVVGIADTGGASAGPELGLGDRAALVPHTVAPYWDQGKRNRADAVDAIFVRAPPGEALERVEARARRVLAAPDLGVGGTLSFVTPRTLLRGVRRLQRGVALSVGSIVLLSLVLGGTTLMSLMTASVVERVPEIGLRRALGATRRDIASLFVAEACVITLAAGLTGVAAALLLLPLLGRYLPLPIHVGPATFLLPFLFSCVAGVLFSWWPARRAALIAPSEALRHG